MASVIERALELAREGRCRNVEDIRRQLTRESWSAIDAHLAGASIRRQLKALMRGPREPIRPHSFEPREGEQA